MKFRVRSVPIKLVVTNRSHNLVVKSQEDVQEEYRSSDLKWVLQPDGHG